MMKTTDNKKPPIRINSVLFAILWALSYVIGAGAAYFLGLTLFAIEPPLQPTAWYILGAQFTWLTTMGLVSGSIQRLALWLHFGRQLTWWRRASVIGWWFGGLVIFGLSRLGVYLNNSDFPPITLILALAMPLTAMQWLVLRQQVDKACLYTLVSLAGAVVFAFLIANDSINFIGGSLAFGGPALVMAYTLVWLFSTSGRVKRKQKIIPDTSRLTTLDADERDTTSSPDAETEAQLMEKLD